VAAEEQLNKAGLARRGLENWIAGDREAAIATFADDIEVFVPADLGNAGHYKGIDEFRSWFGAWDEVWSDFQMELGVVEPVGRNHVVAHMDNRGTGTASGIEVQNSLGWVLEVTDDGRMAYLSLQRDLDAAREHAREREGLA
jgi:ketosteroid isomerase-like protein